MKQALNPYTKVFLASASPRRKDILARAGIRFSVFPTDTDETCIEKEPHKIVESLSSKKADAAKDGLIAFYPNDRLIIIGADTIVSMNKEILLKPSSKAEAKRMMKTLSNNTHSVFTGVTVQEVIAGITKRTVTFSEETKVTFYPLSDKQIDAYIESNEPMDKAGAYAIQGKASAFVKEISGSFHNVVGLPISRLIYEWNRMEIPFDYPKCKAMVLDLDGTIMNTLDSLSYSGNKVLETFEKPPVDIELYKYFVGNGARKLVEQLLDYSHLDKEKDFDRAFRTYMEIFSEYKNYKVKVYDGLQQALEILKERGVKLGVYTNKPDKEAKYILKNIFGHDFFDEIRGDVDGRNLKPDPFAVKEWSKKWDIPTEEILYLGDTNTDMQTGNAANAYTVGVAWGYRDRKELFENGAYDVIDNPSWILNYFS